MTDNPFEDDFFFLDETDLSDRHGSVEQEIVGDEVVLTRVPSDSGREAHVVVRYNVETRLLRVFPKTYRNGDLQPQFRKFTEIQIEDSHWDPSSHSQEHNQFELLSAKGLPRGFTTIYDFGLSIGKPYRSFVDTLEKHSTSSILRFIGEGDEGPVDNGSTLRVKLRRFDDYRAAVDLYRNRGWTVVSRVIDAETHNAVAPLFGLPEAAPSPGRHPMIKMLTEEVATGHVMDVSDRELLADAATESASALAPARLTRLRDDIELVTLDALIATFEKDLSGPHAKSESHWQGFFNRNRFALQLLFSVPVVVEWEQAHVRSEGVTGSGARIADFLCSNVITRTVLLVEIKTPGTTLMGADPYRGKGTDAAVHAPHRELAGAVAQVQSQMTSIPEHFARMLPPDSTIDPWNQPRGAVIVGRLSRLTTEQRASFLRYRDGLSSVTVLAYDEVLERLHSLREALADTEQAPPRT